jgi:CRISPR-associated protein Csm1
MKNFHTYRWEEFENGVCREKLAKLNKWFDMTENPDSGKLQCSMSFLYKLLHLFKRTPSEKINLARLAYLLARKEPGQNRENIKEIFHEMKNTIYTWASSSRDRKEFITALNLMVYLNRKEREK